MRLLDGRRKKKEFPNDPKRQLVYDYWLPSCKKADHPDYRGSSCNSKEWYDRVKNMDDKWLNNCYKNVLDYRTKGVMYYVS